MKEHLLFCPFDGHSLIAEVAADEFIGILLDDKYRIDEKVGEGGMGGVYKATHIHMDHIVAVKILHSHLSSDELMLERFRREARAAAHIRHPHAVAVTDFGVTKRTGIAYLVMEFLEGMDLRRRLDSQKQLSYEEAFLIAHQTCSALHMAHSKNIVHRDLKPDNIWLCVPEDDRVFIKVLDFGIAKLKTLAERHQLTQQGMIIGTPHYMSPEQCRGDDLDARSDIYSLGVILYEILTGQVPFRSSNIVGIVFKHNSELPKPLREVRSDIPEPIESVVLRALQKEPQARQQTAIQMAQELEAALHIAGIGHQVLGQSAMQSFLDLDISFPPRTKTPPQIDPSTEGAENMGKAQFFSPETSSPGESFQASSNSQTQPTPEPLSQSDSLTAWTRRTFGLKIFGALSTVQRIIVLASIALALAIIIVLSAKVLTRQDEPMPSQGANSSDSPPPPGRPIPTPTPPSGMAYIPGGEFIMGYNGSNEEMEKPEHPVTVDSFFMDKHEVTNEDYYKFIKAKNYPLPSDWINGKYPEGKDNLPVTNISWFDADAYCKSLDKRLPKEEEWEYAARGTEKRLYPWGNEFHSDWANIAEPKKRAIEGVGSHPHDISPFNILDMAGNVAEWTQSDPIRYQNSKGNPAPGKIVRGGSFETRKEYAMTTSRSSILPTKTISSVGCRCAKSISRQ